MSPSASSALHVRSLRRACSSSFYCQLLICCCGLPSGQYFCSAAHDTVCSSNPTANSLETGSNIGKRAEVWSGTPLDVSPKEHPCNRLNPKLLTNHKPLKILKAGCFS